MYQKITIYRLLDVHRAIIGLFKQKANQTKLDPLLLDPSFGVLEIFDLNWCGTKI